MSMMDGKQFTKLTEVGKGKVIMTKDETKYLDAKKAYYSGSPIMSDAEFDSLEEKLRLVKSPVVEIVGEPSKGLKNDRVKFKHFSPMLSLAKISADKDNNPPIIEFIKWWKKVGMPGMLEVTPKYDGNAVSIQYVNGKLTLGLTRGDGELGQDITDKIMRLAPCSIDLDGKLEIRGEMLMPIDVFEVKYANFKNPRNLVAGILSSKTVDWDMVKDLHFVPYEIKNIQKDGFFYFIEEPLNILNRNGFRHLPQIEYCQMDAEGVNGRYIGREFTAIFGTHLNRRDKSNYQLDGIVFKICDSDTRRNLGDNGHHPEWAKAVKFAPRLTITTIKDIEWILGKVGSFTPVAILEPVLLDGSMVSKCSLHNYGNVVNGKLFPGAEISLKKAGDIIPQVEMIIKPSLLTDYKFPTECPFCGEALVFDDIRMMCSNRDCGGLSKKKFKQVADLLEMDFFGEKTIEKIYDSGIETVFDLLDPNMFNEENLVETGLFKSGKILDRLIYQVRQIKEIPLWKVVIFSGINNLGGTVSKQIAKMVSGEEYTSFGLQKDFFERFAEGEPHRIELEENINKLKKIGINIKTDDKFTKVEQELKVKDMDRFIVEMTGSPKLAGWKTKEEFMLEANNYAEVIQDKLGKNTNYLICDDYEATTAKMDKANKLGVGIITYADFMKKIK